jgi:hypothetical protein
LRFWQSVGVAVLAESDAAVVEADRVAVTVTAAVAATAASFTVAAAVVDGGRFPAGVVVAVV